MLAKVGNKKITVREFLCGYEFGPAFVKREKDSKRRYLNYMINEKLLAMEGYKEGFADSARVKDLLDAIEGDLASMEMYKDDILRKVTIPADMLNRATEENKITYKLKWIYAPTADSMDFYVTELGNGISFDSLFNLQLKDSVVYADQRSLEETEFKLRMRNLAMFKDVAKMKAGDISEPIKGPDGWYLFKLVDVWKNLITTQTEFEKEEYDSRQALTIDTADTLSDEYVRAMMLEHNPVIQARAFDILRSYMGSYVLAEDKFKAWKLDDRMQSEIGRFDSVKSPDFSKLILVTLTNENIFLGDFINWYKMRDAYLKFDETGFNPFSASLEKMIWQMVRDHLLVQRAYSRGYQNLDIIKQQADWWQDKIVYAVVRDEIEKSIEWNVELPAGNKNDHVDKTQEMIAKLFRKLQQLKKDYKIEINTKVLNEILVKNNDEPSAIDVYTVRKGGTFPHPVYPSIDYSWQDWE
ncbi:MAG TPA: peptidylprolyl isomerase [Candidatus Kryptonia bacterium]